MEGQPPAKAKAKKVSKPRPALPDKGISALPAARVSKIIKSDRDIAMLSKEAIFLVSKSAEQFVAKLTDAAYVESRMQKRKGIQYKDLSTAIQQNEAFFYLQEVIPPPVPLKDALKARKKRLAEDTGELTESEEEGPISEPILPLTAQIPDQSQTQTQSQGESTFDDTLPSAISMSQFPETIPSPPRKPPNGSLASLMNPEPGSPGSREAVQGAHVGDVEMQT